MAITTLDGIIAASSQRVSYLKTGARTTVASSAFALFDVSGAPSGTLAVGNTANGIFPNHTIAGYPTLNTFAGGATGYLNSVEFSSTVASRLLVWDCLFSAGAYAFNATTTLASQPSYAARVPSSDYKGLELWFEAVTAFTGNPKVTVTYTNQGGTTARTTGAIATGIAPTVGRMIRLPLQAGDTGIQKIESVTCAVSTAGTFNIHVMRKLWTGRVRSNNDGDTHDFTKTGLPIVYDTSALRVAIATDSTASGVSELQIDIING